MKGSTTRRRFLQASSVVGIIGITGCSRITGGDDIKDTDGDGVIDSEDYAPRDASVQRAEQVQEADSKPTEPPTETETPQSNTDSGESGNSSSQSNTRFTDDYERSQLTNLIALNESLDQWTITEQIDGQSLQGSGGGDSPGPGARVMYDPEQYQWSGNREISVQYKTDDSLSKRHAQFFFFDDGVWWQIAVTESLNIFRLRWENAEDGAIQNVDTTIESGTVHEINVNIENTTITAFLDGEELISYTHSERIGAGTIGFGVGDGRRTWFDNLRVQPL